MYVRMYVCTMMNSKGACVKGKERKLKEKKESSRTVGPELDTGVGGCNLDSTVCLSRNH